MSGILVTGAAGFIGRFTCSELRQQGFPFIAVDQRETDETQIFDLTDHNAVSSLFQTHSFDTVIHLAAILPSAASANPVLATDLNVSATVALIQTAMTSGCHRFIFGSSMSVYGAAGVTRPVTEEVHPQPIDIYGAAKWLIELIGANFHQKRLLDFSALRIATVIGPGACNTSTPWRSEIFEKLGTGTRQTISMPLYAEDPLTMVHVEDVARMLVAISQRQDLASCFYNTPTELWNASELKRAVEEIDPNVEIELVGRKRALAPLADGRKFVDEIGFEMRDLRSRLRECAGTTCSSREP